MLPAAWGRGVGAAALRHVRATDREFDLDRIRFDAVTSNTALVDWYRREGFTPVGHIDVTPTVRVTCFEGTPDRDAAA